MNSPDSIPWPSTQELRETATKENATIVSPHGTRRDAALAVAALGLPVFRLKAGTKEKAFAGPGTADLETIRRWWSEAVTEESSDWNIGVDTDKLLVLDFDGEQGLKDLAQFEMFELDTSWMALSPRGGRHVYTTLPPGVRIKCSTKKIAPGTDVRSWHGYVAAPGSTFEGKEYRWVSHDGDRPPPTPQWILDRCEKPLEREERPLDPQIELDSDSAIARATDYLMRAAPCAIMGEGGDETTLGVARRLRDFGISEPMGLELMLEHWNNQKAIPPWLPDQLAIKVANAYNYAKLAIGNLTAEFDFEAVEIDEGTIAKTGSNEDNEDIRAVKAAVAGELGKADGPQLTPGVIVLGDPKTLPRRQWLYGHSYIRRVTTATIAPGGTGKSSLVIAECLAMASGKALLGEQTRGGPIRVWYHNQEDPTDELQRRVHAAALHHKLTNDDLDDRLMMTGSDSPRIVVATGGKDGIKINEHVINRIFAMIREHKVDVFVIDPYVSTHRVSENDNNLTEAVLSIWRTIAERTGCAIGIVHHTRKMGSGQTESSVEDARGAGALIAAARVARVMNRMSKATASSYGIDDGEWRYIRVDNGKANFAPPNDDAVWRRLASVNLENCSELDGDPDIVGVIDQWKPPDPSDGFSEAEITRVIAAIRGGDWRKDTQATDWVGKCVATTLDLDPDLASDKGRIKRLVNDLLKRGLLATEWRQDGSRKDREFVTIPQRCGVPREEEHSASEGVEQ